jgi:hypothetical protein
VPVRQPNNIIVIFLVSTIHHEIDENEQFHTQALQKQTVNDQMNTYEPTINQNCVNTGSTHDNIGL